MQDSKEVQRFDDLEDAIDMIDWVQERTASPAVKEEWAKLINLFDVAIKAVYPPDDLTIPDETPLATVESGNLTICTKDNTWRNGHNVKFTIIATGEVFWFFMEYDVETGLYTCVERIDSNIPSRHVGISH